MQDVPIEYITRYGISEVSHFFADLLINKRMSGYVPVLVEDFLTSFFFVEADVHGYPKKRWHQTLSFLGLPTMMSLESPDLDISTMVIRKEFEIDRPLVYQNVMQSWNEERYIFLWQGKLTSQKEVDIKDLDVKELMKLSQQVIRKRDGLIMDEAFVNSFIK